MLRFLRQIPTDIPEITKPSPLEKRHNVVKFPWPINYWVIDNDTYVKVSPTLVKSVALTCDVGKINRKFDLASD